MFRPPTFAALARWIFWPSLLLVIAVTLTPLGSELEPAAFRASDKLEHLLVFFGLAYLALIGWGWGNALKIALGLVALAGAIELLQGLPFVHRDPDLWDWVADGAGILCALALIRQFAFVGKRAQ
jgi:VanZ family protein